MTARPRGSCQPTNPLAMIRWDGVSREDRTSFPLSVTLSNTSDATPSVIASLATQCDLAIIIIISRSIESMMLRSIACPSCCSRRRCSARCSRRRPRAPRCATGSRASRSAARFRASSDGVARKGSRLLVTAKGCVTVRTLCGEPTSAALARDAAAALPATALVDLYSSCEVWRRCCSRRVRPSCAGRPLGSSRGAW